MSHSAETVLQLVVDRVDGQMTLVNNTSAPQELTAYQIDSLAGALNPMAWSKVSGRLDALGDGTLDADDRWVVLSRQGSTSDFSEASLGFGTIPVGGQVSLGVGAWQKYYQDVGDLRFRYALSHGAGPTTGSVDFIGNGGLSFDPLDLNHNGNIDLGDYQAFLAGYATSLAGQSRAQRHNLGDLNGDGRHSVVDFLIFKERFDLVRGAGSFSAHVGAAEQIPEPVAASLALVAGLANLARRARQGFAAQIVVRTALLDATNPAEP